MFANMASPSIEVTEAEQPIQILCYEFMPDKAGAGKYRGGVPFRRDYRFLEDGAMLQVRSDRRTFRPFGLYGGSPGTALRELSQSGGREPGAAVQGHHDDPARRRLPPRAAGGGGWGDPLERDPARGAADVRNELVSPARGARRTTASSSTRRAGPWMRPRPGGCGPDARGAAAGRETPKVQRADPVTQRRAAE